MPHGRRGNVDVEIPLSLRSLGMTAKDTAAEEPHSAGAGIPIRLALQR